MTFQLDQFAAAIRAGGEITARDTLMLRQAIWNDGVLTQAEAQAHDAFVARMGDKALWQTLGLRLSAASA